MDNIGFLRGKTEVHLDFTMHHNQPKIIPPNVPNTFVLRCDQVFKICG